MRRRSSRRLFVIELGSMVVKFDEKAPDKMSFIKARLSCDANAR
jgi:hypothetical protein